MKTEISYELREHAATAEMMQSDVIIKKIEDAAILCIQAINRGNKILLCGNGGSAADAQHIAAELVGRFSGDREPYAAIALTTDTSALTAIGNDFGFTKIFERQVLALANKDDVLICITTSGNSLNVINAAIAANEKGAKVIALTGSKLTELQNFCDIVIRVPSDKTTRIQEAHILIGHILCGAIEREVLK